MALHIDNMILPGSEKAFTIGTRTPANNLNELHPFYRSLLETPVTAALVTTNADGSPQLTPSWCDHDGTYINLNSVRGRLKDRNIRERSSVTLLLMNPENPYHWITVVGTVEQIIEEDDPQMGHLATESIDVLAKKYLGVTPYPLRDPKGEVRVLYKVRPTQIVTFGAIPQE